MMESLSSRTVSTKLERIAGHKWLGRRSNRPFPWDQMVVPSTVFPLARPRIVHSVCPRVANP